MGSKLAHERNVCQSAPELKFETSNWVINFQHSNFYDSLWFIRRRNLNHRRVNKFQNKYSMEILPNISENLWTWRDKMFSASVYLLSFLCVYFIVRGAIGKLSWTVHQHSKIFEHSNARYLTNSSQMTLSLNLLLVLTHRTISMVSIIIPNK